MKLRDRLRISLGSMWNNKLMTLLVVVVLTILSLLVTMIFAFSIDMIGVLNQMSSSSNDGLDIQFNYEVPYGTNGEWTEPREMTAEERLSIETDIFDKRRDIFSYIIYMPVSQKDTYLGSNIGNSPSYVRLDTNPLEGIDNVLVDGRLWNREDEGKPYIWISKDNAVRNNLMVGSTITFERGYHSEYQGEKKDISKTYEVKGIYNLPFYMRFNSEMFLGVENMKPLGEKLSGLYMSSSPHKTITMDMVMNVADMVKTQNKYDMRSAPNELRVYSNRAETEKMNIWMAVGIIAGATFFSLIVILLSIGCISNSIQITVEQNRKFFGVMKAVGLRNGAMRNIILWQAVIMIAIAVMIAAAVSVGILAGLAPVILKMLGVKMGDVFFGLPFYVPFVVFAMQMLLVLIFTRKSLSSICKMDVVSVISEVN